MSLGGQRPARYERPLETMNLNMLRAVVSPPAVRPSGWNCTPHIGRPSMHSMAGGPGGHSEAGGYVLGGLVVGGVDHVGSGTGDVREPRAFYRVDGVDGPEVGEGLVVVSLRRFLGGDVLVEGAAECYVDQLLAPAYAEDRYAAGGSSPDEVEVVAVTQSVDSP